MHFLKDWPHTGGCSGCRINHRCNACGTPIKQATRCTNGRCLDCHGKHCTPGGGPNPGHGYGTIGNRST